MSLQDVICVSHCIALPVFSEETANFLAAADKASWCLHRDEKVNAKGKGQLTT